MTKKENITDFEDSIETARNEFITRTNATLQLLKVEGTTAGDVQNHLNDLHTSAVNYFGIFSRSLNEYSTSSFESNPNIIKSKIDDAVVISNTIIKHWSSLKYYKDKYQVTIPKPSKRAYSTIQAFISKYDKKEAKELEVNYQNVNLPIDGFRRSRRFVTVTDNTTIFGLEIPWGTIALFSGVIAIIFYKIIQSNPAFIDEIAIGFGVTVIVLMLNPKRRFYRAFWSTMSLFSSVIIIPGIDLTAQLQSKQLGGFEEGLIKFIVQEPHWITYVVLGAIAITCLILDSMEQKRK